MTAADLRLALDALPRLGWMSGVTPVSAPPELATDLGLDWFGVKRDDLCPALYGSSKVRKLDYLLAGEPFANAPAWASVGAIGSGHLVALTAAADRLDRHLEAHCFWEPPIPGVIDNLAFIASGPTKLHYYGSRVSVLLQHPSLVFGRHLQGVPVIPPGGSTPAGIVGLVRAGAELVEQIDDGVVPEPERVYVALGSGGTAVGLALGMALAGRAIPVYAVGVVERPLAPMRRIQDLLRETREWLVRQGVGLDPLVSNVEVPIRIVRGFVGRGYGVASEASKQACAQLLQYELHAEPIYSGKAMAAVIAHAKAGRVRRPLLWLTPRKAGPLTGPEDWRAELPPRLARRLADPARLQSARRRFVVAGLGAGLGLTTWSRLEGYRDRRAGRVLAGWELDVVQAAAEALLPPAPDEGAFAKVAGNVDRYLVGLPAALQRQIHALIAAIEHGTTPLAGCWSRLTRLPGDERRDFLEGLAARGGKLAEAYGAIRDLCVLGYYQQPETWPALDYTGPWVVEGGKRIPAYDAMRAKPDARPRSLVR